jgi:hypothetical protein
MMQAPCSRRSRQIQCLFGALPLMIDQLKDVPERIVPYILPTKLDEPVHLLSGPFQLIGSSEARLHADLRFRWLPSTAVEFEGTYARRVVGFEETWTLASEGDVAFSVPVHMAQVELGSETPVVRGIAANAFYVGEGPFEALRFCLTNFPDYNGKAVHYEHEERQGLMWGRLETSVDDGCCQIDKIPEARELVKAAERDAGFVISHVGLWVPSAGIMNSQKAESILEMLHFWFGFLRGAWCGPLFPQGINATQTVLWRQFGSWRLGENRPVSTWLPERTPLNLSNAFRGFWQRWNESVWREPLATSISWFVEANARGTASESRIVLAQVALELLSWVLLVEGQRLHHQKDFECLSAAGRIRALLHHIGVSTIIPDHLSCAQSLCDSDAFDGPGVITKVRNALVHSTQRKRRLMESIDGEQRMECSELALQYLELAILAVCGHDGHYARRGWRGWKGDDEVLVPWSHAG